MRHANNKKRQTTPYGRNKTTKLKKIRTLREKETYKYLEILEADTIKQVEIKEKIKKEYLGRTRKLLERKLNSRNLIKGITTKAFPFIRYYEREDLKEMDKKKQEN